MAKPTPSEIVHVFRCPKCGQRTMSPVFHSLGCAAWAFSRRMEAFRW